MVGKFLCWLGLHDWFSGITKIYCRRPNCDAKSDIFYNGEDDE